MTRRSCRGFSVLECVVALAVVTILTTAAMDTGHAQARASRLAEDALHARLAATSRLETFPRAALEPGRRRFDPGRAGFVGEEAVREVASGLFDVEVEVRSPSGVKAVLATRVAARRP